MTLQMYHSDFLVKEENLISFPHILGSPSSYMTLQMYHSDLLVKEENLILFFIGVLILVVLLCLKAFLAFLFFI
jgi:hypothetical protein